MTVTVFRREIPRGTVISDIDVLEAPATTPPEIPYPPAGHGLLGRRDECDVLDRLVAGVRAGHSQVLVLRGEAGAGKTALLDYLLERAAGCQVIRAAGAESEMDLPFAALHQLCAPFLDRLGASSRTTARRAERGVRHPGRSRARSFPRRARLHEPAVGGSRRAPADLRG